MKASPKKRKPCAGEQTGQISTEPVKPSNGGEIASRPFSPPEAVAIATKPGSHLISELRKLVGDDAVLLPIPRGCKGPRLKGWQHFTPEQMQRPEYLAQLNHDGNIGVLLGRGRATIDLDQDKAIEPFLDLNPKLRETLRTRRVRGCNLWVRITGKYAESCKLKTKSGKDWGEWRADGNQTVIHGEAVDKKKGETSPTAYKIDNYVPPIELPFDEIRWPDDLVLPWKSEPVSSPGVKSIDELRQLYGEPYYTHESGISLNESFWAGLFASENIVLWEPSERAFYSYRPDTGIYEEESSDAIKRHISDRLLKASRQMNCFELEKQRTDSRLNSIVAQLRGIVERRGAFVQRERRIHLENGVFSFDNGGI